MEHPHHQPTFGVAAGSYQQHDLNLFQPEQASGLAQGTQFGHLHTSDNGIAQLNSFGEHLKPLITSNLQSLPPGLPAPVPSNSTKRKRTRDWKGTETSALLERVNLPKFRYQKRKQYYMKWDDIATEIQNVVGSDPAVITGKRCNERMKTLKGYYEKVTMEKKEAGVTEEEWRKSKGIAVDWWYTAIGEFCGPRTGKVKDRTPPTKTYATRFNSLTELQRSTVLDLCFYARYFDYADHYGGWPLWRICDCLSMVQNRRCLAIYEDVIALKKMGLFRGKADDDDEDSEGSDDDVEVTSDSFLNFGCLLTLEAFFEKAVAKNRNPAYDTRRTIEDNAMVKFDASSCAPSGITMLFIHDCENVEVVDMGGFRELRILYICECRKLRELIGCECLNELRCLELQDCPSYHGYPPLQKMPWLQEFSSYGESHISDEYPKRVIPGGELDVSGCVLLRRLQIKYDRALSSIRGLEELRSLTALSIHGCIGIHNLPDIGHMKDLTNLRIGCTSVEEIKGVERLSSLKVVDCLFSKLKTLPDLTHLPHLQVVFLRGCPIVDDPSSLYYKFTSTSWEDLKRGSRHVDITDS